MTQKTYVRNENGALRVGEADVSLESIVFAFQDGLSPEAIQLQYPALTLEEVYGASTYYLANRTAIEKYLAQHADLWSELRRSADEIPSPVIARLRSRLQRIAGSFDESVFGVP